MLFWEAEFWAKAREVKDALDMERVVHVQVYPKEGRLFKRVEHVIERKILFLRALLGPFLPERLIGIDAVIVEENGA